jgi:hypothetical protein
VVWLVARACASGAVRAEEARRVCMVCMARACVCVWCLAAHLAQPVYNAGLPHTTHHAATCTCRPRPAGRAGHVPARP